MTIRYIITCLVLMAALSSCEKNAIRGEGSTVKETRNVSNFESVSVNGSTKLHVTYGTAFSVEVKGYGNLVPILSTEVRGTRLYVEFKDYWNVHNDNTEVFITMPAIKAVTLNGSGHADIKGNFPHAALLYFKISGSGDISMESGSTDELGVEISGSGDVKLFPVVTKEADIQISGSGTVQISTTSKLDASISGSGNVYYKGNPQVSSHVSGSGRVVKEN